MNYTLRLATLAMAALVLVPGAAIADAKKDAKMEKKKAKKGLVARCGFPDPANVGSYVACEVLYWESYDAARRLRNAETRTLAEASFLVPPPSRLSSRDQQLERWRREWEEAELEARSAAPQYPRLAWLNGIWCSEPQLKLARVTFQTRWQVQGPTKLREALYRDSYTQITERMYRLKEEEGYLKLERFGYEFHRVFHFRKDSNDQYTQIYVRTLKGSPLSAEHKNEPETYFRCEPVKRADEPARLDQDQPEKD